MAVEQMERAVTSGRRYAEVLRNDSPRPILVKVGEKTTFETFEVRPETTAVRFFDVVTVVLEKLTVISRRMNQTGWYFVDGETFSFLDYAERFGTMNAGALWEQLILHPQNHIILLTNGSTFRFRPGFDKRVDPMVGG